MWAARALAMGINLQGMIMDGKAALLCDRRLPVFDVSVKEFFNMSAIKADQMIVMGSSVELEYRLSSFKMVAHQQAGLFELGQYPINRGQANINTIILQAFVNIFGAPVAAGAVFKKSQHFESRQRGFKADILKILGYAHRASLRGNN